MGSNHHRPFILQCPSICLLSITYPGMTRNLPGLTSSYCLSVSYTVLVECIILYMHLVVYFHISSLQKAFKDWSTWFIIHVCCIPQEVNFSHNQMSVMTHLSAYSSLSKLNLDCILQKVFTQTHIHVKFLSRLLPHCIPFLTCAPSG